MISITVSDAKLKTIFHILTIYFIFIRLNCLHMVALAMREQKNERQTNSKQMMKRKFSTCRMEKKREENRNNLAYLLYNKWCSKVFSTLKTKSPRLCIGTTQTYIYQLCHICNVITRCYFFVHLENKNNKIKIIELMDKMNETITSEKRQHHEHRNSAAKEKPHRIFN